MICFCAAAKKSVSKYHDIEWHNIVYIYNDINAYVQFP